MSPIRRKKSIAYYRASTDKQGRSGLGLEAQQTSVRDYLNGDASELVAEFIEVESGKRDDRPELAKALEACRRHKAKLVIAKIDRLSRKLSFIAALMDSGVPFESVDNPHASKLNVHILAAFAEHERDQISQRTKDALAKARARGTKLGNPKLHEAAERAVASLKANADQFAANVVPIVRELQANGAVSYNAIAGELNRRNVRTARGGRWTHITVRNVLARATDAC